VVISTTPPARAQQLSPQTQDTAVEDTTAHSTLTTVKAICTYGQCRYDHERGAKGYPLFRAALVGYALGLMTTIVVMNWFDAAQPALLYIVPGVLLSTMGVAAARGEVKQLLLYDENGDADAADATEAKKTE